MAPLVLGLLRTATRGAWTTLYLRAGPIVLRRPFATRRAKLWTRRLGSASYWARVHAGVG